MSSPMQLAQDHLDMAHACMIAAKQAFIASRNRSKVIAIAHARTGSEVTYNQLHINNRQTMLYVMVHRTSESAYAAALESFRFQQSALE